MSWFRFSAIIGGVCGATFFFLPHLSNVLFGVNYVSSPHAEDWTQLFGLSLFGLAFILNAAHTSKNAEMKRSVAHGMLLFTLPCALVMTYWQVIPDGRWNRLDIVNIMVLYLMSYGLFVNSGRWKKDKST
jgi:cytochrome bd-type quinol oxidase subunit 2